MISILSSVSLPLTLSLFSFISIKDFNYENYVKTEMCICVYIYMCVCVCACTHTG